MSLWDAYEGSNQRAVDFLAALPPEPPKPQAKWNAWSTPVRAVVGAAASSGASLAEVISGFGAAGAIAAQADPVAVSVMPDAVKAGAEEGRRQLDSGEAFTSDVSRSLRYSADYYRPDPLTAGKAEQTIYGLLQGVTQAVGHAVTFGPAAPLTFGVDQGLTSAEQLEQQGVDPATRAKAAAVAGAVNAAGFLIPVAGKTWAQTVGLGFVSGPGSFVSQQYATQKILEDANYAEIAKQYDPLDPWALGASMLPFGFGALAMRGRARLGQNAAPAKPGEPVPAEPAPAERPAPTQEAVDAAMVHNLTQYAEASRQVGEMDQQVGLSQVERAVERRFAIEIQRDPEAALRRYAELPDTRGGKIVNTDDARELSSDYSASIESRSLYARAVHEPSSWLAKLQYERLLAAPPKTGDVLILGGGGGSGKSSTLEHLRPGFENEFDAIYDTTLSNPEKAQKVVQQALDSGRRVTISFTVRAPLDAIVNGVLPRARSKGRTVPIDALVKAHEDAPAVVGMLADKYADDPRVTFKFVDNTLGRGNAREAAYHELPVFDYNGLTERATEAVREAYKKGAINEAVFRGLVGEREAQAGAGRAEARSADGGTGAQPEQGGSAEAASAKVEPPEVVAAREAWQNLKTEGGSVDSLLAAKNVPDPVANLLIGLSELDQARGEAMLADYSRTVEKRPDQPAADMAADVVEAARRGEQVTPEAVQPARAAANSIADRVARVEQEAPDMVIRVDEDGQPVTVADELARIRREAVEGTDSELGSADAGLLKVAADCALSLGQ